MKTTVEAVLSVDRKFVLCGAPNCKNVLCRRSWTPDGHRLEWESGWVPVGDHLERYGRERLADGRPPARTGGYRAAFSPSGRVAPKKWFPPNDRPARCDRRACLADNILDSSLLDVTPAG